jgi:hypothetical protein
VLVAREDCFSQTGARISVPRKQKQARQPFAELTMMPLPMHGEVNFKVHYCILILNDQNGGKREPTRP